MVRTLSESEIMSLVDAAPFARLGCHADGKTYVVPISFVRDGSRLIGLTTEGQKIDMMRQNPAVCVEIDDVQSLTQWRCAILTGHFEELSGPERTRASGLIIDKYGPEFAEQGVDARRGRDVTPPRLDGKAVTMIAYAIQITEMSGRSEGVPPSA